MSSPTTISSNYYASRYSVALFAGPNPEMKIDALPGMFARENERLNPLNWWWFKNLYEWERANGKTATVV